jgi:hypothetical protein
MRIEQPAKLALLMVVPCGAAKRKLPEAGAGILEWAALCPEPLRNKRDDRLGRPSWPALTERARPAFVLGPVFLPPWSLQRPPQLIQARTLAVGQTRKVLTSAMWS